MNYIHVAFILMQEVILMWAIDLDLTFFKKMIIGGLWVVNQLNHSSISNFIIKILIMLKKIKI